MRPSSRGKIFLADERGLTQTAQQQQRYSTFSFGSYAHPHKQPFGSLHGLNDERLASRWHCPCPLPATCWCCPSQARCRPA